MVYIDNDQNYSGGVTPGPAKPSSGPYSAPNPFDAGRDPGSQDAGALVRAQAEARAPAPPPANPNYGVMTAPPGYSRPAGFTDTGIQSFYQPQAPDQSGGFTSYYAQPPDTDIPGYEAYYQPAPVAAPPGGGFANPARPGGYNLGAQENYAMTTDAIVNRWLQEAGPLPEGRSYDWEPIYNRARQVVSENIQPIVQQYRQANPTREIDPFAQEAPISYGEYLNALAYQRQEAERQAKELMSQREMMDALLESERNAAFYQPDDGGWKGKVLGVAGKAMEGLDLARKEIGAPVLGEAFNDLKSGNFDWDMRGAYDKPIQQQVFRGMNALGLGNDFTRSQAAELEQNKQTYNSVRDHLPRGLQIGLDAIADPLTWVGPGAVKSVLGNAKLAAPIAAVVENPLKATLGAYAGQAIAGQAASSANLPAPLRAGAEIAGAIAGGLAAPAAAKAITQRLTGGLESVRVQKAYASSPYKEHIADVVGGPEPKKPWKNTPPPPEAIKLPSDQIRTSATETNLLKAKSDDLLRASANTVDRRARELRAWYEGGYGTELGDLNLDMKAGNDMLINLGFAVRDGKRAVVKDPEQMLPVFRALHGLQPPESLDDAQRAIYTFARKMADKEELESFRFDPNFVMIEGDYFAQFWRMSDEVGQRVGRRRWGSTPTFQLQRANSFDDAIEKGFQPLTWNPVEMAAVRRELGIKHRQVQTIVDRMKDVGVAVEAKNAPIDWRVPEIGPAFQGKEFPYMEKGAPQVGHTPAYAVPKGLADTLEAMVHGPKDYGKWEIIWNVADRAKQQKLVLSLFQHVDMTGRMNGSIFAGALNDLRRGNLIGASKKFVFEIPADTLSVMRSTMPTRLGKVLPGKWGEEARTALQRELLSDKAVSKLRPDLSYRMLGEAGLRYYDSSVVRRDLGEVLGDIRKSATHGVVRRNLDNLFEGLNAGLFDGVVPTAQRHAIANHIAPQIIRQHPEFTAPQLARAIADEANIRFSTLGDYQSVIQQPTMKKFLRLLTFSSNETEGLLRQAFGMVAGDAKAIRTQYFIGQMAYTAVMAELIHKAVTGDWLPLDRLNPVDTDSQYGRTIPGTKTKVSFSRNFLSPDIPFTGRNGTRLSLDLLGQADTVFRLIDPVGFASARLGILPRALKTQLDGKDFYSRDITSPRDRLATLASDLAEPISVHELRSATGLGPDTEGRIGAEGHLIQAGGFNVKGETNQDMRDRYAREYIASLPETTRAQLQGNDWNTLTPKMQDDLLQKYPNLQEELRIRNEESPTPSTTADTREAITFKYLREQEALDARYRAGELTMDDWNAKTKQLSAKKAGELEQLYAGLPEGEVLNPLDEYYRIVNSHRTSEIEVDWEAVQKDVDAKPAEWQQFVNENLRRNETDMQARRRADLQSIDDSGYFDLKEGRTNYLLDNPDMAGKVQAWGYSKPTFAAMEARRNAKAEQAQDDADLKANHISMQQWKDQRKARVMNTAGHLQEIYKDSPNTMPEDVTAMVLYSQIIDRNTPDKTTNITDWEGVERELSALPESQRKEIDSYESRWATPVEKEYRAATKLVASTGWFDIEEKAFTTWAKMNKVSGSEEEVRAKLFQTYYKQQIAKGKQPDMASIAAWDLVDSFAQSQWGSIANDMKEGAFYNWNTGKYGEDKKRATQELYRWGFYTPIAVARAGTKK